MTDTPSARTIEPDDSDLPGFCLQQSEQIIAPPALSEARRTGTWRAGDTIAITRSGRVFAVYTDRARGKVLGVVEETLRRPFYVPVGDARAEDCDSSPEGEHVLVPAKTKVWEVDLRSGDSVDLVDLRIPVRGAAYLDRDHIVCVTRAEFFLVNIQDRAAPKYLRQVAFGGERVWSLYSGEVVIVCRSRNESVCTYVFHRRGEQFFRLGTFSLAVQAVSELPGKAWFSAGAEGWFALCGLDEALQSHTPNELEEIRFLCNE